MKTLFNNAFIDHTVIACSVMNFRLFKTGSIVKTYRSLSDQDVYVDQDIVLEAMQQSKEILETDLNITVIDIDVPRIDGETTSSTTTSVGESGSQVPGYLIAVIIVAGVLLLVTCLIVFLCCALMYANLTLLE